MIIRLEYLNIQKFFGLCMIFFSFIPWIHFGLNNRDSQPWPLMFAILFIIFSPNLKFKKYYLLLALIPVFCIWVWLSFSSQIIDFIALRAIVSYLTFSLCLAGFILFLKNNKFPWKILIFINLIYLFVGILQLFIPDITSSIVQSRGIGQAGRGVTSLAPEPTFFAIFLYLISFIFLIKKDFKFKKRDPIFYLIVFNILSIIFLARSSTVILFLFLSIFFFAISRMTLKQVIYSIILISFLILIGYFFLAETRIGSIFNLFYDVGVIKLVYIDESINDRVANVIYPLHGAYLNNFMPGGFHSFTMMHGTLNDIYNGFFHFGGGSTSIMSFIGVFIYELGFIGILILLAIFIHMQDGKLTTFANTVLIFIILNSSVPPSFPLVPFLFALFFLSRNNFFLKKQSL